MTRAAILVEQNWNTVPGGTARATNNLIDALHEHTDARVVGVHGLHRRAPGLELPSAMETARVPFPGRVIAEAWSRGQGPSIDRWIDADVVHAPAYVLPKTKKPLVATIHDLAFVRHPEWFTPHGVRYFTRFLDRVRDTDTMVITPSQTTANDCAARGIDRANLRVIPWGIDVRIATDDDVVEVRQRYSLPEVFVLFVGTLEPRKNLTTLAEAMSKVSSAPLVVAGPTGWGDVDLPGSWMLGEVPAADIEALMAAATVLAYPSHFEGFGLPVLEAMAQGTPVVTTAETAPAEVAGGGGLTIDSHSVDELADALRSLIDSPEQRRTLGEAAKIRAADFRWDVTARATAKVYEEIS
ncbi:MAG: glycosyltransferase involved in cell wall biosynthesis [Verrucomicrobiales bacterium]